MLPYQIPTKGWEPGLFLPWRYNLRAMNAVLDTLLTLSAVLLAGTRARGIHMDLPISPIDSNAIEREANATSHIALQWDLD